MARERGPNRGGFTVVEIIISLVLLSFMIMLFQAATGRIIHEGSQSDRQSVAVQLVQSQLALIQLETDYESLTTKYAETATAFPDFPGLTRTTVLNRTEVTQSTGILDYTTVTVEVDGAGLRRPVRRTLVVGAP